MCDKPYNTSVSEACYKSIHSITFHLLYFVEFFGYKAQPSKTILTILVCRNLIYILIYVKGLKLYIFAVFDSVVTDYLCKG